jgi:hypothetical protein
MVQALLEDRKTQTRRVITPQPGDDGYIPAVTNRGEPSKIFVHDRGLAPHQPGDILWVRETFTLTNYGKPVYKADFRDKDGDFWSSIAADPKGVRWRPSIHMPRTAARIFLSLTAVRAERVQDITAQDAVAEGITWESGVAWLCKPGTPRTNAYVSLYADLWDNLNAKRGYGWDPNPWVWVYTFERVEKPQGWPTAA